MGKETVGLQETLATVGMQATAAIPEIAETMAMLAIAAAAETQEVRAAQVTTAARTAMPEELEILQEAMLLATATATATATAGVLATTVLVKADLQAKTTPQTLEERQAEATHPPKGTSLGTAALRAPRHPAPKRLEGCQGS
ncbi:hypothetical protein IC232_02020 [Microvirga sp. BT688]|uniref:hypothetical protein n=1 Tax=Microvirga sp. TaxID=1873136 RepID=UPI00168351B2|nr:hypothetical protein [Microvirga sp.]MBD2745460.1 hypothetical protein [Microvirga sp.]